jgi:MFS transporter, Spinster family, sphingosine-1-phosphate transporter
MSSPGPQTRPLSSASPVDGAGRGGTPSRAAWAALGVLTFINLFNYLDRYVVPAVAESIKHSELHVSDAQVGLLGSAFFFVYMFAAPVFGAYGSRPWRLRLVATGVAIWSIATAAGGLVRGYGGLLGARATVGIGEAAYSAIAPAVLADYFPERLRGRVFAVFFSAIPVGSALGFITGGFVDHYAGWRAAFLVAGLPGLLAAALTLTLRNPLPGSHDTDRAPEQLSHETTPAPDIHGFSVLRYLGYLVRPYMPLFRNSGYILAVLGYAAYTFGFGGISFWMPAFLTRVRGLPGTTATWQLSKIVVLTGFAGTFLGGWVGDAVARRVRQGYLWVSGTSMLAAVPCVYLALTASSPTVYWTALAAADLLLFVSTSPINTVIVGDVPPASRAAAMAASIFAIHLLGDVPSPWLIGQLSDATSLGTAVLIIPVAVLVSGLIWTCTAAGGRRPTTTRHLVPTP